jgi:transcriptional regulator with XRE-family HTH domain
MSKEQTQTDDKDDDRKALGERLREAREYLGFSQDQVATFLGVSRSALSLMETGQRKVDALELKKLAGLYKRPVGHFTGEETEDVAFGTDVKHLARQVSELSPDDREELGRFADFLRARKQKKGG